MDALTAAELSGMRTTVAGFSPDTVTISRQVTTSDGMGSRVGTWSTLSTCLGRLGSGQTTSGERLAAGTILASTSWTLHLPSGTDVTTADRVTVLGQTFEVTSVHPTRSWVLQVVAQLSLVST